MVRKVRRNLRITRTCAFLFLVSIALVTLLYEIVAFSTLEIINKPRFFDSIHNTFTRSYHGDVLNAFDGVEAQKVQDELAGFREVDIETLANQSIINTVHYVWCTNKTFGFINYLSVLSVWKILQPDIIEFHVEFPPIVDKYNTWIEEIQLKIPGFVIKPLPKNWDGDENGCGFWFGLAVIDDRGGIYVGENVILGQTFHTYREKEMSIIYSNHSTGKITVAVASGKQHWPEFRKFRRSFNKNKIDDREALFCRPVDTTLIINYSSPCFIMKAPIHPADIFQLKTPFGSYARTLMYGSDKIKVAKSFLPGFIPNIVHYVWFGDKQMDFFMYLSMLSTLFILNPEKVLIHTDGYLRGHYVEMIKRDKRVLFIEREKPFFIYGKSVLYSQHRSDIVRAECLLKFGGIYMDWDVLWLKSPDDVIRQGYDAIANFDHMASDPFPDTINLGVLMAKPKSTFIKRWQDALINYRSKDFLYNAVQLPYKIFERFPEYIHIERRLQVMCFHLKCHPAFHPSFKNFMQEQPFDWRSDVFAIHFTYPDPPELSTEQSCRNGTGLFAEMCQYILEHSHRLDAGGI